MNLRKAPLSILDRLILFTTLLCFRHYSDAELAAVIKTIRMTDASQCDQTTTSLPSVLGVNDVLLGRGSVGFWSAGASQAGQSSSEQKCHTNLSRTLFFQMKILTPKQSLYPICLLIQSCKSSSPRELWCQMEEDHAFTSYTTSYRRRVIYISRIHVKNQSSYPKR